MFFTRCNVFYASVHSTNARENAFFFTWSFSCYFLKHVSAYFNPFIVFLLILILGTSIRKRDERAKTVSQSCKTWYGYCDRYLRYNGIPWLSNLPEWVQRKHHVKLAWNTVRIYIKSKINCRHSEWTLMQCYTTHTYTISFWEPNSHRDLLISSWLYWIALINKLYSISTMYTDYSTNIATLVSRSTNKMW